MAGGLSARELIIIARLQNAASGPLQGLQRDIRATGLAGNNASLKMFALSNAFETVGRGLRNTGAVMLIIAGGAAKFAADFDQGMRLVRTQTDISTHAFNELKSSVINMSVATGKSTDELAEGLFDIFSSINVNAAEAETMLGLFAKAGVAGATDVRTVVRGTISVMNAFGLSAKETSRVLDAQFNLVKFGVGTYQDFAGAIGKLTPSVVAAGGSIETMTGLLAFTTRNGLSASESVTSLARAYDLISRPKVVKAMKDVLAIDVVDKATGKYKQMDQIITEMATTGGLAKMTEFERKQTLQKIFGQGEIRANRFFNLAIPRFKEMGDLMTNFTGDTAMGAMPRAFDEMAKSGRNLLDRLKAIGKAFLIEFGGPVLEVIRELAPRFGNLVQGFRNMDDSTKNFIAKGVVLAGVISLVSGAVMLLLGGVMRMISIFQLAGVKIAAVAGPMGIVVAAVTALVVALSDFLGVSKGMSIKIGAFVLGLLILRKAFMGIAAGAAGAAMKSFGLGNALKSGVGNGLKSLISPMNLFVLGIGLAAAGIAVWIAEAIAWRKHTNELGGALANGTQTMAGYETAVRAMAAGIDNAALKQKLLERASIAASEAQELARGALNRQLTQVLFLNNALGGQAQVLSKGQAAMIRSMIASGNFVTAQKLLRQWTLEAKTAVDKQGRGLDALSNKGNSAASATWAVIRGMKAVKDAAKNAAQGMKNMDAPIINLTARYQALAGSANKAAGAIRGVDQALHNSPYGHAYTETAKAVKQYRKELVAVGGVAKRFSAPTPEGNTARVSRMTPPGESSVGPSNKVLEVHFHGEHTDPKKIIEELDWYRRRTDW